MVELLTSWLNSLKNADHVGLTTQIYDNVKDTDLKNELYKSAVEALGKSHCWVGRGVQESNRTAALLERFWLQAQRQLQRQVSQSHQHVPGNRKAQVKRRGSRRMELFRKGPADSAQSAVAAQRPLQRAGLAHGRRGEDSPHGYRLDLQQLYTVLSLMQVIDRKKVKTDPIFD